MRRKFVCCWPDFLAKIISVIEDEDGIIRSLFPIDVGIYGNVVVVVCREGIKTRLWCEA